MTVGPPPWAAPQITSNATPDQLVEALEAAGWQVVGQQAGVHKRLAFVEGMGASHEMMVPLDPSAPEFERMRAAVLWKLERMVDDGEDAKKALDLLGEVAS